MCWRSLWVWLVRRHGGGALARVVVRNRQWWWWWEGVVVVGVMNKAMSWQWLGTHLISHTCHVTDA
jgi:hypothetical protein